MGLFCEDCGESLIYCECTGIEEEVEECPECGSVLCECDDDSGYILYHEWDED